MSAAPSPQAARVRPDRTVSRSKTRASPGRCGDRAPLVELSKERPSITSTLEKPACRAPEGAVSKSVPPTCAVRPRGSSPPRRFASPNAPQACCILQATMGFTGLLPRRDLCRGSVVGLSRRCVTLQSLPLPSSRATRRRGPLPPRRAPAANRLDLEALLQMKVRCAHEPLPAHVRPLLSWASLPGILRCAIPTEVWTLRAP